MSYRQQGYRPQAAPRKAVAEQNPYQQTETYRAPFHELKHKRRSGRTFRFVVVLFVFALLSTIGVMGYRMYDEIDRVVRMNTFYPGIYIEGLELNGYTPQEVFDTLTQKIKNELSGFALELVYGDCVWVITRETLGMTDAKIDAIVGDEINKAFCVGRDKSKPIWDQYNIIMDLRKNPYEAGITEIGKDFSQINEIFIDIRETVYIAPTDATQVIDYNLKNPVVVNPEVPGQEMDEVKLRDAIERKVNAMESGTIYVPTKPVASSVAADDFNIIRIANASTQINRKSTEGRIRNVERGCEAFNGLTVEPGRIVSFNNQVGPRTKKNGFYEAEEIVSGGYELGIGGGICQVSTTLYQAVIQAGLEVVERQNHMIPVNYTERGSDATVADGRIDFRFKNNTDTPIYITARVTTSKNVKYCEFQIYGRPIPNNYQYTLRHEEKQIPMPDRVEKIWDTEQKYVRYTDQTHEVPGRIGYKVDTYLITSTAERSFVEERLITTDTYQPVPNRVYIGVERR